MVLQQRTKEWLLAGSGIVLVVAGLGGLWYWETMKSADVVTLGITQAVHADLLRHHHRYGVFPSGEEFGRTSQFGGQVTYEAVNGGTDFTIPLQLSTQIDSLPPGAYVMSAAGLRRQAVPAE